MFKQEILKFDDNTNLCSYIWLPNENIKIKGTVQIAHGMAEHLGRYHNFAEYLNQFGYIVVGADHYGHGLSVKTNEDIGIIKDYNFMDAILNSIKLVREHYYDLFFEKKIIFAHSMGSMAIQRYIELYPDDFNKVIISGTDYPFFKYSLAKLLTTNSGKNGKIKYTDFIHNMGVGSFNNKFKKEKTEVAWLTNNVDEQNKYLNDSLCGRRFPDNYYHSLAQMLLDSKKMKNKKRINIHSEVMIMAGMDDPVGGFGKGPKVLAKKYLQLGLHVHLVLYENARHECLNEIDIIKNKVYRDILSFLND